MSTDKPLFDASLIAADAQGRPIVSIHTKKTYRILENGRCVPAEHPVPLLVQPVATAPGTLPFHETDVIPFKTATDLIVIASAHGRGRREMTASIQIGSLCVEYQVIGDRTCSYRSGGRVSFSEPATFETMPLRYEHAYGGCDTTLDPPEPHTPLDLFTPPPGLYPRNPVGRGYVVNDSAHAIEGLTLPNIEHPRDRLRPENLIVRAPQNWWRQPIAWSCDWFGKSWYPRSSFYGCLPEEMPHDDREMPEVRMKWAPPGQHEKHSSSSLADLLDLRFANAASPALVLPFLRGNETIVLRGMTPSALLPVALPHHRPRIVVRSHGRNYELPVVPHRILLSTEEMGLSIVWHGAFPLDDTSILDAYPEDDIPRDALDIFIDGRPLLAAPDWNRAS